jgi:uncharacterized protein (UPF0276 family)
LPFYQLLRKDMPLLTVNYSVPLAALYAEGFACFDGIEIGPWFPPEEVVGFRQLFSAMPFYFHASSVMTPMKRDRRFPGRLKEYLACTESPWLSYHIELLPLYIFRLSHLGLRLPPPETGEITRQFIDMLVRVKEITALPIVLENLHSIRGKKYDYAASPEVITEIVKETGSGFLLDIAHARVAAEYQEQEVRSYIKRLPLDKLAQIHVSGVRLRNGRIYDAHESMGEEDYCLLEWVLDISRPQVVTLEYFREKEALREQLLQLKEILAG